MKAPEVGETRGHDISDDDLFYELRGKYPMSMYGRGSWCVWSDGEFLSAHATRNEAVAAARKIQRAETQREVPRTVSVGRIYQGERP